ncbi:MAG: polyribonucleotide nucleotidyltransferase [Bacteroidetes bacterium]|nr:MAG: polyribonucleotide nucleotidyltransferase [Bacteroidota bacterium]
MSIESISKSFELGDGRQVTIETGKLAKQADGSVVVKVGNTMLLATVVSAKEAAEHVDFMPLSVDYREKYAALGRFPGGFFKRETKASDYEVLISRLVDRACRPLFPDDYHAETQVLITLISGEKETLPDAYAALAASSALTLSDIPFHGPISEVRVARIEGEFVINPSVEQIERADLELIVAASIENIMMVEGEMKEVSEEVMMEAMKVAHEAIKEQCRVQLELAKMAGKPKRAYCHETNDEELEAAVHQFAYDKCYEIASQQIADKHLRSEKIGEVKEAFIETLEEGVAEEKAPLIGRYFHKTHKKAVRDFILESRTRIDGRQLDEIRPIWCETDYLPSVHGSAIFTRGETQSLSTVTLGSKMDMQVIDGAVVESKQNFILHYNFPPFSTGEIKPLRATSRREVGHGNLALRALKEVLPPLEENPYTIRIVSDILESNGSSSMATVCAGTLALMDAGVQIKNPVSGIAMGLISDAETGKYAVLSDILGDEDHLGDMDFKVTGTENGLTACQMDIKIEGLSYDVLAEALEQSKRGRMHILEKITDTMAKPRDDYKDFVPRIETLKVGKEFIGAIIGPGGKIIQEIQAETETTIIIEEVGDFGIVDIFSPDKESIEAAKERIRNIVAVPEVGEVYKGKVKTITAFGAFIEIIPGKEGLLHVSEIAWERIQNVEDVLKVDQEIEVKLIEVDEKTGKLRLSRKVLLEKPEGYREPERRGRGGGDRRPRRDFHRPGGDRDHRNNNNR